MPRPGGRCTTTAPGCAQGWPRRRSGSGPSWSSAASPLTLDRGGMRRAWLRGRENLRKRYLVHVAGYNLGLVMRLLVGAGTPREFLARASAHLLALATTDGGALVILVVATGTEAAMLVVSLE